MDRLTQLEQKVEYLTQIVESLANYSSIPIDYGNAMKARILTGAVTGTYDGTAPATVTINESGSSTVVAAAPFTGKLQLEVDGAIIIVPTIN